MKILMMLIADLYRFFATLFDAAARRRVARGRPRYDVACIANFETPAQMPFMGFAARGRVWAYGLRFALNGKLGRYMLIRSCSRDLETAAGREVAKAQAREAIDQAAADGAGTILFAAGTKRLFTAAELDDIRRAHADLVFTIGDHGTGWALLQDVFGAVRRCGLNRRSRIMVIGPNGFLGGIVTSALRSAGFDNLALVSHRDEAPFEDADVALVVACSHHRRVRLTAEILARMGSDRGVHVVDVCKPTNLSRSELARCPASITRQDAGNTFNPRLRYVFSAGAGVLLRKLKLSLHRMYGCFSEAIAIAHLPEQVRRDHDFMDINPRAMALMQTLLPEQGFAESPVVSFGRTTALPTCDTRDASLRESARWGRGARAAGGAVPVSAGAAVGR